MGAATYQERPSLPSQGSDVVDMELSSLGFQRLQGLLKHSQEILEYEKDVPVHSLLASSVRLTASQYAEHCSFSTQVSPVEANSLGHYSFGKVSSEKQVEKLSRNRSFGCGLTPRMLYRLLNALKLASNEASLIALEEAMLLATAPKPSRGLSPSSPLTSCPSTALAREVE